MSKFETRMATVRSKHASLAAQMKPLREQLAALQAEAREVSKAAWLAHDEEFVMLVKAQMLTGEVQCVRCAYSTLGILGGEDRDFEEEVGVVRAVVTGRKHVGVWVWFGKGPDVARLWRWVPASEFRSGYRYKARRAKSNDPIGYPAFPKELREIR